ncbi:phosphoribosylanthranilate isomerase [Endomicrobium proavitum]|uniref:N-(5'-phosphoribosyl)anthranilate isomerase n=1 Tax=Endomicrobium proavitum TaxID=1408281 RepID=A0A0G3WIF8_9BACT|nr:phosphoribosylanthranilate isomerase [Endomicrobium proavitum]AKL98083.1 N-(5-phosphoribosyl)anthranilate isomerase [Endomicrobium proavitum]
MSKIKICGLKRTEDIKYVNKYLPDYAGFVFAPSKRQVSVCAAAELRENMDERIKSAGVFVNEDIKNIELLCKEKIINLVQLHGDEDDEYIKKLKDAVDNEIIKVVKINSQFSILNSQLPSNADYLLFDSGAGSGKTFDWDLIKDYKKPYFLAGGINLDNVCDAVKTLSPYCIDVSSGVETGGVKDEKKISKIISLVRGCRL